MQNQIVIDGNSLTLKTVEEFLFEGKKITLSTQAKKQIEKSRKLVEKWVNKNEVIYGVTTGFGEFANVFISKEENDKLQENLILSHAVGCGEPIPPYIVKLMMLLRVNALAKGYSGIRLEVCELLVQMINNNIIPVVPSQGSVGSSGDLVQLSHIALALIGKGRVQVFENNDDLFVKSPEIVNSEKALMNYNLSPVQLKAKEGLALINGTQMMTAYASYICIRALKMSKLCDISAALSHEALRGTDKAYDLKIHHLRPYPGQINTAKNLKNLIENSQIRESHKHNDPRVQDAYSLRCIPQIHGASKDAINYVCSRIEIELNSANDNPLIFPDYEEHLEGGNFHGQPVALAMDFMAIALSELANVAERRIERMVNGALSYGLPRFLTSKGGLNSGLMIAQYTAASLVSENKVFAHPASVDSIPTSANQEDHNSMGSIAAQKCFRVLRNLENVIAIELLTSTQALEFLKPHKAGKGTFIAYKFIRNIVPPINEDRVIYYDVQSILNLIHNNSLLNAVEKQVELMN